MKSKHQHSSFVFSVLFSAFAFIGCNSDAPSHDAPNAHPGERPHEHGVEIVSSRALGTLEVRAPETKEIVEIECATCHGLPRDTQPASIHSSLTVTHGELTCNMCHSQGDRSTLHLADGSEVLFEDTRTLCAQCHGPQNRDYKNGSHGGMSGHWDLSQGPRVRNDCTNCHDPHRPAYPVVDPAPGPRDRFLKTTDTHGGAH